MLWSLHYSWLPTPCPLPVQTDKRAGNCSSQDLSAVLLRIRSLSHFRTIPSFLLWTEGNAFHKILRSQLQSLRRCFTECNTGSGKAAARGRDCPRLSGAHSDSSVSTARTETTALSKHQSPPRALGTPGGLRTTLRCPHGATENSLTAEHFSLHRTGLLTSTSTLDGSEFPGCHAACCDGDNGTQHNPLGTPVPAAGSGIRPSLLPLHLSHRTSLTRKTGPGETLRPSLRGHGFHSTLSSLRAVGLATQEHLDFH